MECQKGFEHRITLFDGRTVIVRKVIATDGPGIKRFFEQLSDAARDLFYPHPATDEAIAAHIARAIDGKDWTCIALCGDAVVAYFFLHDIQRPIPVLGIGIADNCQGGGLGQQLVRILIDDARRLGKAGIELTTRMENKRALHIYQKIGFQYRGEVPTHDRHGAGIREHRLVLPLVNHSVGASDANSHI